jgi:hypothetical protein
MYPATMALAFVVPFSVKVTTVAARAPLDKVQANKTLCVNE